MAFAGDPVNASNSAIYLPRINRMLVDQLEAHLRGFCTPAADRAMIEARANAPEVFEPGHADATAQLRSDQLESTLRCLKQAARTMAELDEQAVTADERAKLQDALARLEQRLLAFERDYEAMSIDLRDARREAEENRCRAQLAEHKLESVMEAVTKMIAPLGHQEAMHSLHTLSAGRAALRNDEVRV